MSVQLTLEFDKPEDAILALGKLIGVPAASLKPAVAAGEKGAESPAPAAVAPTRPRKPRADAGQPRGPYKDKEQNVAGTGASGAPAPGTDPGNGGQQAPTLTSTTTPVPAAPQTAAPVEPKPSDKSAHAPESPAAGAAVPSPEDVQKAVERLFTAKDFDVCEQLLSRFGVKRGRDLRPDHRADFIKRADGVIAGEAV